MRPIALGIVAVVAWTAAVIEAASTPLQEYCVYANFSSLSSYSGSKTYSRPSPAINPGNWRSRQPMMQQQLPPSRSQWPSVIRQTQRPPRPSMQSRPSRPSRPYAPAYPSYYMRNLASAGGYYSSRQRPSIAYRPSYRHQRFVRDTLAAQGFNPSEAYLDPADAPVSRNIIAGDPIEQKSWPFLIALLTTGDTIKIDNEYWDLVCGGTLIHPQFILTAAHCFVDEGIYTWKFMQASEFRVRIGDYNLLVPHDVPAAVDARVLSYTAHPRYDHKVVENGYDIALIQLDRPVRYNDWIKPACLPSPLNSSLSSIPRPNVPCQVAGWGAVNNAGRLSPIPRFTTLPSSRQSLCYNSLQVPVAARDGRLFCAGDLTGKKDSCSGDSGGPIFCLRGNRQWEFSGIVSFGGERCAQQSIPGAYTTVSYFINWVSSTMRTMMVRNGQSTKLSMSASHLSRNMPPTNTRRPVYPPPRFSSWQPSLPGMSSSNRNQIYSQPSVPMASNKNSNGQDANAIQAVAESPKDTAAEDDSDASSENNGDNQTSSKSPAALLNLLQLLLNTFGGSGTSPQPALDPSTTSPNGRLFPLEFELP